MLAMQLQTPEIAIEESEGEQFMKAAQRVMRHYSVTATQKSLDAVALFGVALGMYGPRIAAIRFRKAQERAEAKTPRRPTVVPFPQAGTFTENMGGGFRDPDAVN